MDRSHHASLQDNGKGKAPCRPLSLPTAGDRHSRPRGSRRRRNETRRGRRDRSSRRDHRRQGRPQRPRTSIRRPSFFNDIRHDVLEDALLRLGDWVAEHGIDGSDASGKYRSGRRDLLLRNPPRRAPLDGADLRRPGEDLLATASRGWAGHRGGVLPIQGPPGAGKTYAGRRG